MVGGSRGQAADLLAEGHPGDAGVRVARADHRAGAVEGRAKRLDLDLEAASGATEGTAAEHLDSHRVVGS